MSGLRLCLVSIGPESPTNGRSRFRFTSATDNAVPASGASSIRDYLSWLKAQGYFVAASGDHDPGTHRPALGFTESFGFMPRRRVPLDRVSQSWGSGIMWGGGSYSCASSAGESRATSKRPYILTPTPKISPALILDFSFSTRSWKDIHFAPSRHAVAPPLLFSHRLTEKKAAERGQNGWERKPSGETTELRRMDPCPVPYRRSSCSRLSALPSFGWESFAHFGRHRPRFTAFLHRLTRSTTEIRLATVVPSLRTEPRRSHDTKRRAAVAIPSPDQPR